MYVVGIRMYVVGIRMYVASIGRHGLYRDVCRLYREGSYYAADMLDVANRHLREGSSRCIYTPFRIIVFIIKSIM